MAQKQARPGRKLYKCIMHCNQSNAIHLQSDSRTDMRRSFFSIPLLSASLLLIAGCGSDSSTPVILPSPASTASMVSVDKQFQQKVYIIDEIKEPTQAESESAATQIAAVKGPAEAAKQVFVNRLPYDGTSSDAPVFIAADQVASLSDIFKQGLLATYRNSFPIILIRAGEREINTLLEILDRKK